MKLLQLASGATLALTGASALALNLGAVDMSSGSAAFSNTPIAGLFTDTLTFTLGTASLFNGSVTSVLNGSQDVDFTSISVSGPSGLFNFSNVLGDPVELWAAPGAGFSLSPGVYTMTLSGVNSAGVGSYGANVAVTPVPEPETYALLLAGIGVVGFMARRRSW